MAIETNAAINFFGTQDEVTSGTPATIANALWGKADEGGTVSWTNDDDALWASAVLKCQFDTTFPTKGTIELYAHLLQIQSTNDPGVPSVDYPHKFVAVFPIDFSIAADVDFYTHIALFQIPVIGAAQAIDWYIRNNLTGQTIGVSWQLWITPISPGPHG